MNRYEPGSPVRLAITAGLEDLQGSTLLRTAALLLQPCGRRSHGRLHDRCTGLIIDKKDLKARGVNAESHPAFTPPGDPHIARPERTHYRSCGIAWSTSRSRWP